LPALKEGYTVLCDRFVDASIAYQGEGRGIDADRIVGINEIATMGLKPHLTILLDIDPRTGLKRKRNKQNRDRMEKEEIEFYDRVRRGYLKLAEREPERIKKVDASRDEAAVHSEIVIIIENLFKRDK
jgi:dTMP kinase